MNSYAWFVRGKEHAAMAETSIESVLRADREARIIVVTDEKDPEWIINHPHHLRVIAAGQPIMLANLEAQIEALNYAQISYDEQITFLDTDTILLKKISVYRDAMGVINFTWRDHIAVDDDGEKVEGFAKRMPYNYGVVVAVPGLSALEVLIWMRERIRRMVSSHQKWYGNQLAAAEFAGSPPEAGVRVVSRNLPWRLTQTIKKIPVGQLPCEQYNYTPQSADDSIAGKFVLHFKGKRRNLMWVYADKLHLNWSLPRPEIVKDDIESLATVTEL